MEERRAVTCCQSMLGRVHNHWVCEVDVLRRQVACVGSVCGDHNLVTHLPLCESLAKLRVKSPEQVKVLPQQVVGDNLAGGA